MKGILRGSFLEVVSREYKEKMYHSVVMYSDGRVFNFNTKTPEVFSGFEKMQLVDLSVEVGVSRNGVYILATGCRAAK